MAKQPNNVKTVRMVLISISPFGHSSGDLSTLRRGAIFGALNTMYTAVASRNAEIATLRALGFSRLPVVISVLLESIVLALVGGLLGAALSFIVLDGYRTATINWQSFSQVAFSFDVTPQLVIQGIVVAAIMGLMGGLFPAIRAARQNVAVALREK